MSIKNRHKHNPEQGSRHRVQAHPQSLGGVQAVQGGVHERSGEGAGGGSGCPEALQPVVRHEN